MECPKCQHLESTVLETRRTNGKGLRRRRQCLNCYRRFTTYEQIRAIKKTFTLKK